MTTTPTFFATPDDFRNWLEENHAAQQELWVGYYKKATGKPSITWSESVDQALCFGWIDGLRKSVDDESYMIRFTPRRPTSQWSKVNLQKVDQLIKQGLMRPAGIKVYEERRKDKEGSYSYEQRQAAQLTTDQEAQFRANAAAWEFFQSQPPTYRNTAIHWVISAKQEKTRQRRLGTLIDDSAQGLRIAQLRRKVT
ncbi:YdeI/OmpD-associated family protein [Chloroflexi bacterium TSY]|nr:YdeI/OmpD-associated family protein [Chloroflexi bacterium TSY]